MTDPKAIAAGLSEAQRAAVLAASKNLGWASSIGTVVVLMLVQFVAGSVATFWFGLGALITGVGVFWEAGRNIKIKEEALIEAVREALQEQSR